jgi:glycine/D-amino acid oxidase-like deaminating enzyme
MILVLWEYQDRHMQPVYPIPIDGQYADIALRGLVKMIPDMQAYVTRPPRPRIDGGYYTKTIENRPLIGKLPVQGAYLIGALSGFGLMASCAAGELLAAHVTGRQLPPYAAAFMLDRYQDRIYLEQLEEWRESGQL